MTTRPTVTILALGILVSGLITVGTGLYLVESALVADPITVRFVDLPAELDSQIQVIVKVPDKPWGLMVPVLPGSSFRFFFDAWIQKLVIRIPTSIVPKVGKLEIRLGQDVFYFTPQDMDSWQTTGTFLPKMPSSPALLLDVPIDVARSTSFYDSLQPGLNWPGDKRFLEATLKSALVPILFLFLAIFLLLRSRTSSGRRWCRRVVATSNKATQANKEDLAWVWNWSSLAFLILALAFLEYRDPYYFTQDDNLVGTLPALLFGCQSAWQGMFPHYNPFWFCGGPLANLGIYSLTYPPTYLAYGLARHLLANENATLEIFAILHLLVGFLLTRLLARRLGMGPLVANLVSLSFVLSGAMLIMGRCWHNWIPVVVWQPLLCLALVRLQQGPVSWSWLLGVGLALGMPYHVGFSQMALYCSLFFVLGASYLAVVKSITWRRAACIIPSLIIGAGLALPLLYQQWLFSENVTRPQTGNIGIGRGLGSFFFPYPLLEIDHPMRWGNWETQLMGHLFFFGGVLAWLLGLQVVGLTLFRPQTHHPANQVWTFCAMVALWLGLADVGGLWTLLSQLPVIGPINRHSFRLLPFLVLFAALAGGLTFQRMLPQGTGYNRRERILAGMALLLLLWHVLNSRTAFYYYQFKPFPELPRDMEQALFKNGQPTGRATSWARLRSSDSDYPFLLPINLGTFYRVPLLAGYDPLLEGKTVIKAIGKKIQEDPPQTMKAYGVRWHLTQSTTPSPSFSIFQTQWFLEQHSPHEIGMKQLDLKNFPVVAVDKGMKLQELPPAEPLAFVRPENPASPGRSLDLKLHALGVDVDISKLQGKNQVVVNFVIFPFMEAYVDGEPLLLLSDNYNRLLVHVPPGQVLSIRYRPPWETGLLLGSFLGLLGFTLAYFLLPKASSEKITS
jgi:hypothetical protein